MKLHYNLYIIRLRKCLRYRQISSATKCLSADFTETRISTLFLANSKIGTGALEPGAPQLQQFNPQVSLEVDRMAEAFFSIRPNLILALVSFSTIAK